jgi:hypothetical protein
VNVTNKDLLQAISATEAVSVNAGHKLGNNDGYYVAKPDGALWATTFPAVSNGDGALVYPLNAQARTDAPDLGVDVPADAPILKNFTDRDPRAVAAVTCATAPHS